MSTGAMIIQNGSQIVQTEFSVIADLEEHVDLGSSCSDANAHMPLPCSAPLGRDLTDTYP